MEQNAAVDNMLLKLSDSQILKAQDEIKETESARVEGIATIRKWVDENGNLYTLDDLSILWFLRGCKFDVEKTKSRIENFYSFRARVPEWYDDRDPCHPELMELSKLGNFLPLPGRDRDGRKITFIRACLHNPYKHKQDNVFKVMNMLVDLMCRDDEAISMTGVVAIVDLTGASFGHAMQMTPSMIRKAVSSWQDVTPIRTKSMHFINTPYNGHVILNIFKKFMKQKLRDRVHAHGNGRTALQTIVPIDNLPVDYGGKGPSLETLTEEWSHRFKSSREWFIGSKSGPYSH